MLGLKDSRQFSTDEKQNQNQSRHVHLFFSRALSELQVIYGNCDWFIAPFAPVVM